MDTNYRNGRKDYGYYGNSCLIDNEDDNCQPYLTSLLDNLGAGPFLFPVLINRVTGKVYLSSQFTNQQPIGYSWLIHIVLFRLFLNLAAKILIDTSRMGRSTHGEIIQIIPNLTNHSSIIHPSSIIHTIIFSHFYLHSYTFRH